MLKMTPLVTGGLIRQATHSSRDVFARITAPTAGSNRNLPRLNL